MPPGSFGLRNPPFFSTRHQGVSMAGSSPIARWSSAARALMPMKIAVETGQATATAWRRASAARTSSSVATSPWAIRRTSSSTSAGEETTIAPPFASR